MTKGFTLIEIMIVVAILGIISAVAIPTYNSYVEVGRGLECDEEVAAIALAEEVFAAERLTYFAGASVAIIEAASGGYYTRTARFISGTAPCTIAIIAGPGGITTQYKITATGINELAGKGTIAETQNYP